MDSFSVYNNDEKRKQIVLFQSNIWYNELRIITFC